MAYYDCAETARAVAAFFRHARRDDPDANVMQPNRHDTCIEGDLITIATGKTILARYRVQPDGTLRRLRVRQSSDE